MFSIMLYIDKDNDFEINNNIISVNKNNILLYEYVIKEDYKIYAINTDSKTGISTIIIGFKNIKKPSFIPKGYNEPRLSEEYNYYMTSKLGNEVNNDSQILSYIDTSNVTPDYIEYVTNGSYIVSESDIPKSFWMSTNFECNFQNFEWHYKYVENYDKENASRFPTDLEFISTAVIKHQQYSKLEKDGMLDKNIPKNHLHTLSISYDNWSKITISTKNNGYVGLNYELGYNTDEIKKMVKEATGINIIGDVFFSENEIGWFSTKDDSLYSLPVISEDIKVLKYNR